MALPKLKSELFDPRAFTYRELLAMERAGILGEDERVELLHGSIVPMTVNPPHASVVRELTETLSLAFLSVAKVDVQNPLRLSADLDDRQLPIPDLMLLARRDYEDHPQPGDVHLLIEVSDTTLLKGRQVKLPLYAAAGVIEVWLFNLEEKRLEVYAEPQGEVYRVTSSLELSELTAPRRLSRSSKGMVERRGYREVALSVAFVRLRGAIFTFRVVYAEFYLSSGGGTPKSRLGTS